MTKAKNWLRTDIVGLRLEIEGRNLEVTQLTCTYALNEIPRATCVLGVGRNARNVLRSAGIHEAAPALDQLVKAKIFWKPSGDFDHVFKWSEEEMMLFDGYVIGFGYEKINGQMQAMVSLGGWLMDLAASSSLSQASHPSNPSNYAYSAVHSPGGSGSANKPSNLFQQDSFSPAFEDDVWTGIKDNLCRLANRNLINRNLGDEIAGVNQTTPETPNTQALEALKRIEGGSEDCAFVGERFGPPLVFDAGEFSLSIARGVADAFSETMLNSYAYHTFWDKIIGELGPSFMFSLVPMVDRAMVVPFQPGSRALWKKEIKAEEYDHIGFDVSMGRPIKTMIVQNDFTSQTMINVGIAADEFGRFGIGGFFRPGDKTSETGVIKFIKAPSWIGNIASTAIYAANTTGVKSKNSTPSATTPSAKTDKDTDKSPKVLNDAAVEMCNKWARAMYALEALQGRVGSVSGKLRFDIAPGSNIRIAAKPEIFLGAEDSLATDLIGQVSRVTFSIDAEGSKAGTAFRLFNVRTAAENTSDKTSVDGHPLYTHSFTGAPLIPEYEFSITGGVFVPAEVPVIV